MPGERLFLQGATHDRPVLCQLDGGMRRWLPDLRLTGLGIPGNRFSAYGTRTAGASAAGLGQGLARYQGQQYA